MFLRKPHNPNQTREGRQEGVSKDTSWSLTLESRANNINAIGLAIKIQNIAKALLPGSVFDLFLWHNPLAGTRRADWHRLSLHTNFHTWFLHQFLKCPNGSASSCIVDTTRQLSDSRGLRRGIIILQVSTLFMGRKGAPAHLGSFSGAPALLRRLRMQGRWHGTGYAASGADWGPNAALITCSSCIPSSCDQELLLISHLPIFAENNRRKTPSLDEFQHLIVFADKTKTGQWTNSHLQVDLDHWLGGIFFEWYVFKWSHMEGKVAHVKRQWWTVWDSGHSGIQWLEKKAKLQYSNWTKNPPKFLLSELTWPWDIRMGNIKYRSKPKGVIFIYVIRESTTTHCWKFWCPSFRKT